jgi:hypothetical protein
MSRPTVRHDDVVSPNKRLVIRTRGGAYNRDWVSRLEVVGPPKTAAQPNPAGHLGPPLLQLTSVVDSIENDVSVWILGEELLDNALYTNPLVDFKICRV